MFRGGGGEGGNAQKIKVHILFSIIPPPLLPPPENRAVYEIMWKKHGMVETDKPQMMIGRMRKACWLTKATDTHSEYVILIAFPLKEWLHEGASVLLCMCVAYPVVEFNYWVLVR
jgi:hypothetical protein